MTNKRSYTFGVITTVAKEIFRSAYHREILAGLFDRVGRLGHTLSFVIYRPGKYRRLEDLLQTYGGVDGFFMIAWRWFDPHLLTLIKKSPGKSPLVLFNDYEPGLRTSILYTDVAEGMEKAVSYLCGKGHRRIAAIHGPSVIPFRTSGGRVRIPFIDVREKVRGFERALRKRKINVPKDWLLCSEAYTIEEGYRLGKQLLQGKERPEAVVCGNDDLAAGALQALKESGLQCPGDVAITGFDDTERASLTSPQLTTLAQPLFQMGQDAVDILIRKLRHTSAKSVAKRYLTRLVPRASA